MHRKFWLSERSRHLYIAIAIALLAGVIILLKPLDITAWAIQSRLSDRDASGTIALVEVGAYTDQNAAEENRHIASLIRKLRARGATRIFVNIPLRESNLPSVDEELSRVLYDNLDYVYLAGANLPGQQSATEDLRANALSFERLKGFDNDVAQDFLRFVWTIRAEGDGGRESLAFALSRSGQKRTEVFIDGTIDSTSIPRLNQGNFDLAIDRIDVPDTAFVIGVGKLGNELRVAKHGYVTNSVAHILGAETLLRGTGQRVAFYVLPLAIGLALLLGVWFARTPRLRRMVYAACVVAFVSVFVGTGLAGVQAHFADTLLLLTVYASLRALVLYKQRHLYIDPITRLPNFSALRRDFYASEGQGNQGVVVVKILRLDSIFAHVSEGEKRAYLRQVSDRLCITGKDTKIYFDGGKYFAFMLDGAIDYESHLSGLRAIVSQPIIIASKSIDVAVTVGADFSSKGLPAHRLSSAIAAADHAREAFQPVFIVSDACHDDEWDHSLTARLAEALAEDRISIKVQPQVDLKTGKLVAAEVLARWQDQAGNEISPARFIPQFERMARLDELTGRILDKAMAALRSLQDNGCVLPLSVNVSAVQFVDDRIAEMVEKSLRDYAVDPSLLKIEVTETARIEDFETARKIVERLRSQGIAFSLDDFGVGSANLEALQRLPFDEVKIDQLFIQQLAGSCKTRAIVEGVLHTTSRAGMTSVAEGIEDLETHTWLSSIGCDRGQGYFIAKPMVISQFRNLLELNRDVLSRPDYG
ncbi:EAL domain-containing protein [Erythrobacter sp. YJ-T3-07]|uniref:EAL domain-containing protein n=1 Tax=Erythrobacter sp. YJ-T3-07 TaxID=2793063 RepID=UPI0018D29816|nr:EAL domain-containing protein [Erythrobacter sp. YJ-T3-07]